MPDTQMPLSFLLTAHAEEYPRELVRRFPHVARRIEELWNDPAALGAYLTDLMIPSRPDRQGFPPEVAGEIMALGIVYDSLGPIKPAEVVAQKISERPHLHLWEQELAVDELERRAIPLTVNNFAKAAEAGDRGLCLLFISAGLNVDTRDARQWTPLMLAAFNGREALAIELIHHGADVHAEDRGGYTPMHWAAYNGYREVVKLLIEKGVPPNVASHAGITPILQAAARGHLATVVELLENHANPNLLANDGSSPLLKAVANGHVDVIKRLLAAGASTDVTMANGTTLLDVARSAKNPAILVCLTGEDTWRWG